MNYMASYSTGLNNASSGGALAAFFAAIGSMMLLWLAIYVVFIIANWKIYTKAGRAGWKSLIPIYNMWVLFEIVGWEGWKIFLLLIPFYNIYLIIKFYIELSKAYSQESIFALGLILLNPVFMLILAFGNAKYARTPVSVGPAPEASATPAQPGAAPTASATPAQPQAAPEDPWVSGKE